MMTNNKKNITILGATGSIGLQTLQVIKQADCHFELNYLTINTRIDLLEEQLQHFTPKGVVITEEKAYNKFKKTTNFKGEILFGDEGLLKAVTDRTNDMVVSALVGFSGVVPTLAAIQAGTTVGLANKETLVSAGIIITEAAKKNNVALLAIDSEHNAIFQCLAGENFNDIEKLILTASGGPFLNTPIEAFEELSIAQALNHPNWSMGNKITIDSATMMNKGFEVIEAHWLFDIPREKIDVVIHPQSIIHSMVMFHDGSIKAQMGLPDMRLPIAYALSYPVRLKLDIPRLNFDTLSSLTFEKPDLNRFRCLHLAYEAMSKNGTSATILNAANEIAVNSFLNNKIKFTDIVKVIEKSLEKLIIIDNPTLDDIINIDSETRIFAENYIDTLY